MKGNHTTKTEKIDFIGLWNKERNMYPNFIKWMDVYEKKNDGSPDKRVVKKEKK